MPRVLQQLLQNETASTCPRLLDVFFLGTFNFLGFLNVIVCETVRGKTFHLLSSERGSVDFRPFTIEAESSCCGAGLACFQKSLVFPE